MKQILLTGVMAVVIALGTQIGPLQQVASAVRAVTGEPTPMQLTTGGCCTQPFWSPDGKQVRYIDRPIGGRLGIYGVLVDTVAARPVLISERVEDSRIAGPYRVETTSTTTALVRLSDGKRFNVPAQGRAVHFSPDFKRIAWSISNPDLSPEQQVATIWVANVDGTDARRITTLRRGGVTGWISDAALLVNGQDGANRAEQVLWTLSIGAGKLKELARAERLRSPLLSPSGRWVAYYTAFNEGSPNGLWLADTNGGKPKPAPREAFGAYQWRPGKEDRLVVIPFRPDAQFHELWQLDPTTLELSQLTNGLETPFKIANGDWRVSPDGRRVAYVESKDRNIWVVNLP